MTNFEMDLFDPRCHNPVNKDDSEECCKNSVIKPACLPITILTLLILSTFFFPLLSEDAMENIRKHERTGVCTDDCILEIVESIPTGMNYSGYTPHKSTFTAWMELLEGAESSVDIAAFYWSLRDGSGYPTSVQGAKVFQSLIGTARRGVKVRIAQNQASSEFPQLDSAYLEQSGLAEVRNLNFTALVGSGVLHTKLWVVDQQHIYLGSANMDWRSLTEVKEMGVLIRNCSCLATDIGKQFTIYWRLGEPGAHVPSRWPINLRTNFNTNRSLDIHFNSVHSKTFISSSPAPFNPKGREHDLNAIVGLMRNATQFVRISVMDYLPTTLYQPNKNYFWPELDDAIRSTAYRGIHVQMLISQWRYSRREMLPYLRSLLQINAALPKSGKIEIRLFTVPSSKEQERISHGRVNHNKYMTTDQAAYVGTSNWVGDYFISTGGLGFIVESANSLESNEIVEHFNRVFLRDWNSPYAKDLSS